LEVVRADVLIPLVLATICYLVVVRLTRDVWDVLLVAHSRIMCFPRRSPIHQHRNEHGDPYYRREEGYYPI
jgi:hypothetical protein